MKCFSVVIILAANAAAQDFISGGTWQPYTYASATYWGRTSILNSAEHISRVDVFKGSNGCISGVAINSPSGSNSYDFSAS